MEKLITDLCEYVSEVAGLSILVSGPLSVSLPNYLAGSYDLYEISIGKERFLGVALKSPESFKPVAFEKHMSKLMDVVDVAEFWLLIAADLPSYTRRRLVARQSAFVLPWRQLHWPELGMAVQARKKREPGEISDRFKPATQAVVLHGLIESDDEPASVQALSKRLGYTPMTISRAFDELESAGLGCIITRGRERLLSFPEGSEALWERARKYLRTPVRQVRRVRLAEINASNLPLAGESALSRRTVLTAPQEPVFAASRREWKQISRTADVIPVQDDGTCRVQIWRYEPRLFVSDGTVDPFSLYQSLKDERDERIEMSLDELME